MSLVAAVQEEERCQQKFTVLMRGGGGWSARNIRHLSRLAPVSTHADFPEFVILFGEVSRKDVIDAVGGYFQRSFIVGFDNPKLPFTPSM